MSQKDSSSKIKAQPGAPGTGKRAGSTKYKMQAAQLAQEAAKIAAQQEAQAKAQKEAAARGESQSEDTVRGLWKSRVLASYKSKGAKDSNTLLAKISDGKAALEVGDRHKSANVQEVMVSTVDKMFDVFQNCAYEFNKIAAGTELEINWIRPFLSKEVTANWQQQEHANLIFSGRVSTRRWTMVVKGTVEEVVVFILPADKLIGFALSANNFKPYFTMIPISENLDVRWQIEEHIMPPELFHNIYKELFNGLIRFAREEAHPDEVFTLRQIGIEIPTENEQAKKEEEIARQKAYQDAFFQDMRSRDDFQTKQVPEFAKPELPRQLPTPGAQGVGSGSSSGWKQVPDSAAHNADNARLMAERNRPIQPITPEAAPKPQPVIPQQAPPLPQMHPQPQPQPHMSSTMTPQWPSLQQQPVAPQPPLPQVQPSAPVAPQPMMPQVPPVVPSPPKFPQPQYPQAMQFPQQQPPQAPPYQQPAPPPQPVRPATFPEALSALLGTLDQELEVVAKAGSDAFAQRDLARADAALKFSGRLSEFRTLARELWEYYGGGSKPQ
ncbi:MAG: hypothetical protein EKK48_05800 [Candidatus Melainabacteria bacterium]|nr:MAG: hypothetical protein EKK48_05800 [Candidatus Melainabacteria bacterium]